MGLGLADNESAGTAKPGDGMRIGFGAMAGEDLGARSGREILGSVDILGRYRDAGEKTGCRARAIRAVDPRGLLKQRLAIRSLDEGVERPIEPVGDVDAARYKLGDPQRAACDRLSCRPNAGNRGTTSWQRPKGGGRFDGAELDLVQHAYARAACL